MATRLWVVANATGSDALLTNTEHDYDTTNISKSSIVHTGGRDGNFIRIPDCSGPEYYADHHLLIKAPDWTVALWNNDAKDHLIYWNPSDSYSESHVILISSNQPDLAILIQRSGPGVTVTACTFRA